MKPIKILIVILLIVLAGSITACTSENKPVESEASMPSNETVETVTTVESTESSEEIYEKLQVVVTLFPHYDFAKAIGGEYVTVDYLLPPGIESHSYEPTPKDMIKILDSDVFLFTNVLMEPWIEGMVSSIDATQTSTVDLSKSITLLKTTNEHTHDDHAHEDEQGHETGEYDPHYWTDPNNAILMVDAIEQVFIERMPEKSEVFSSNADQLRESLMQLDASFIDLVKHAESKTILSGGHFAFGYFAERYGLSNLSPYIGFSPDAEPTPKSIAELINTIKETKSKAIFYEELIEPRVAKIISEETGVEMLLLHGAHNVSKSELETGVTYIEIMKGNLERLKIGLGYDASTN